MTKNKFSTLMYHGIHDTDQCKGNYDAVYSVTYEIFCQHLSWLQKNNYQATTLEQTLLNETIKSVVITFDDGDISNYLVAFPELVKRGMLAEFYITTDWINTNGYMTDKQLKEMSDAGMSIQSHGKTHAFLSDINSNDLHQELTDSKQRLEAITGQLVHTIALPGGRGLPNVIKIHKQLGYQFIGTSILGSNNESNIINRITITSHCDIKIFSSLISSSGLIYNKALIKQYLLNIAKKILGNNIYNIFRTKLLGEP